VKNSPENLKLRLASLLQKLREGKELADIFDYFLREFAEDQDFIALGQLKTLPGLAKILINIADRILRKKTKLNQILLTGLPDHGFYHGSAIIDRRMAVVFYFESANQGLMALSPGLQGGTEFARFSFLTKEPVNMEENVRFDDPTRLGQS
jgi:hypothetical protein